MRWGHKIQIANVVKKTKNTFLLKEELKSEKFTL